MTVSIWRYSHLFLALISSLFLLLASVTGIILAFEPVDSAIKPYNPVSISDITLSEVLHTLENTYSEVLSLELDENDFLSASVISKTGESETIYVHPETGEKLGEPQPQAAIFQFTTNLHRSLFLKSIGRFFVGLVSFLLCLIATTGFILLIKRQGGLKKFFSKVQKDYFELRYHVILSRWFLLPIIIIAATGVYLSAEKFSLLPDSNIVHQTVEPEIESDYDIREYSQLQLFQSIRLSEVRQLNFPFSEMPEDYYELSLRDKELHVHQYTGEILSEVHYPFTTLATRWSLLLHTGKGSIVWSIVLLLASISILFFIYSGFVMWIKRSKNTKSLSFKANKDNASHILLVGSETGTTFFYAKLLADALKKIGKSVFMAELNEFTSFKKAEHIIILTSTYGEGEAPTNARKFETKLKNTSSVHSIRYSVVGFGSLLYPKYCAFANEVDTLLQKTEGFDETLPIYKINDQNDEAFLKWVDQWGKKTDTPVQVLIPTRKKKMVKQKPFKVIERTAPNSDDTFLIRLRTSRKINFKSGDLAGITPEDGIERKYSIAKVDNDILLSVKKHEFGICSSFLSQLKPQETVKIHIEKNTDFHFPIKNKPVLLIANGTGIAPFLGMLHENHRKIETHLFLGLRNQSSLELYESLLSQAGQEQKLKSTQIAYSREEGKEYVQDLVRQNPEIVSNILGSGGHILICGSLAMQKNVLNVLETITVERLDTPLKEFERRKQLKMDCY